MIPPSANSAALETCLEMDEAPIVHPVLQCSWCKRWMIKPFENVSIYGDAPTDGRPASHGICIPCKHKYFTSSGGLNAKPTSEATASFQ